MEPVPHRGDLSQDSELAPVHRSTVTGRRGTPPDPASERGRQTYNALSASSVGLELGISVVLGLLFGIYLDGKLDSEPWAMLGGLVIGLIAGFRGVLRAVERSDRAAEAEHG